MKDFWEFMRTFDVFPYAVTVLILTAMGFGFYLVHKNFEYKEFCVVTKGNEECK